MTSIDGFYIISYYILYEAIIIASGEGYAKELDEIKCVCWNLQVTSKEMDIKINLAFTYSSHCWHCHFWPGRIIPNYNNHPPATGIVQTARKVWIA